MYWTLRGRLRLHPQSHFGLGAWSRTQSSERRFSPFSKSRLAKSDLEITPLSKISICELPMIHSSSVEWSCDLKGGGQTRKDESDSEDSPFFKREKQTERPYCNTAYFTSAGNEIPTSATKRVECTSLIRLMGTPARLPAKTT
jgi:hypothetical protein